MQILISSTNKGKIAEIRQIINDTFVNFDKDKRIEIISLGEYDVPEPEEPFNTFLENAIHKAKYYANLTGKIALADDSGICISALNGFPGVRTKDFTDECGSMEASFIKLEEMLEGKLDYATKFCTAIAVYFPQTEKIISAEGFDEGFISFPLKGLTGFGFDPVFIPKGHDKTISELGVEFKNSYCHRSKALKIVLKDLLG